MSKFLPDFLRAGWEAEIGSHLFTADEIIAFARKYDPQPFHIDAEAARQSLLGGLCASGWHTTAVCMRKHRDFTAARLARVGDDEPRPQFGPSPGFEKLRWLRPVFAGETIRFFNATLGCRESRSKKGWHILSSRSRAINEDDQPVLSFDSTVFVKLDPPTARLAPSATANCDG